MTEGTHLYGDRAPHNEQFVVLAYSANIINERVLTGTANQITVTDGGAGAAVTLSVPADFIIPTTITIPNTGLHILDTNASHDLIIAPGSDLTADRQLTLTTGDAARTITLSGNPTLNDWFDQSVKIAATPTFVTAKLSGLTDGYIPYHVADATGLANSVIFTDGTNVGIGTATPGHKLDIASGYIALVLGADEAETTRTNATAKSGRLGMPHYTNAEEPVGIFLAQSTDSENDFMFGGGSALLNAATLIRFYTAGNQTTTTGTERMRLTGSGYFGLGTSHPVSLLHVGATSDGEKQLLQTRDSTIGKYTGLLFKVSANIEDAYKKAGVLFERTGAGGVGTLHLAVDGSADAANTVLSDAKLSILSNGYVGIGVTDPDTKLEVFGSTGLKISFDATDNTTLVTDTSGDLTITPSGDAVIIASNFYSDASYWWYCKYMDVISLSPGGSGATQVIPTDNVIGGYNLDAATEYLYFNGGVCNNWDGASDLEVKIRWQLGAGGANAADTVDLKLVCYYMGNEDTTTKTQTLEVPVTVGTAAINTMFTTTFTIDWDLADNVVEEGDIFSFRLNLETDTSEVDNVTINFGRFRYRTATKQPTVA